MFGGIFPQPVVFRAIGLVRLDKDHPAINLNGRAWLRQQVVVPASILLLPPIGSNQKIKTFHLKIGNRRNVMPARPATNGMEQQNGLRAQAAANGSPAGPNSEGI